MKPSELLDKPEKWTKDFFARDANNTPCTIADPDAVCFCVRGDILKTGTTYAEEKKLERVVERLFPKFGFDIAAFNDDPQTTFEDVRRVLIEAGL